MDLGARHPPTHGAGAVSSLFSSIRFDRALGTIEGLLPLASDQHCSAPRLAVQSHSRPAAVAKWMSRVRNVAGDGTTLYSEMVRAAGKKPLALPAPLLYPLAAVLWALHFAPFPAGMLDMIRFPWVADNTRLKKILLMCLAGTPGKLWTLSSLLTYCVRAPNCGPAVESASEALFFVKSILALSTLCALIKHTGRSASACAGSSRYTG